MLGHSVHLSQPLPGRKIFRHHQSPASPATALKCHCAVSKQATRFLHSLSSAAGDAATTNRLIRKFVTSSPKSISLDTLSHLISHPHLSALSLPFYEKISEASWFRWNPKLIADLIASLEKKGLIAESERLRADAISRLDLRHRDLALFYCNLIDSHSILKSQKGFDSCVDRLKQIARDSSSVYVKRRAYESMIKGHCEMGCPDEAENLVNEMRLEGIELSDFEFRAVVYGYGKLGLFEDMSRFIEGMDARGFKMDTVCANMVLSSYGAQLELTRMLSWLRRMKTMGIALSIRTYNTVLNSCPAFISLLEDRTSFPLLMDELHETLKGEEALLVNELVDSAVLREAMEWGSLEVKLDLHGMHLGTAYLIMLQWMEEMRGRLSDGKCHIPAEITVVCGSGKHSSVRGESPVKQMVRQMLGRARSPMRINRKNTGCFIAKGSVFRNWLCLDNRGTVSSMSLIDSDGR